MTSHQQLNQHLDVINHLVVEGAKDNLTFFTVLIDVSLAFLLTSAKTQPLAVLEITLLT